MQLESGDDMDGGFVVRGQVSCQLEYFSNPYLYSIRVNEKYLSVQLSPPPLKQT